MKQWEKKMIKEGLQMGNESGPFITIDNDSSALIKIRNPRQPLIFTNQIICNFASNSFNDFFIFLLLSSKPNIGVSCYVRTSSIVRCHDLDMLITNFNENSNSIHIFA